MSNPVRRERAALLEGQHTVPDHLCVLGHIVKVELSKQKRVSLRASLELRKRQTD